VGHARGRAARRPRVPVPGQERGAPRRGVAARGW
jgi:hypothetical protein